MLNRKIIKNSITDKCKMGDYLKEQYYKKWEQDETFLQKNKLKKISALQKILQIIKEKIKIKN